MVPITHQVLILMKKCYVLLYLRGRDAQVVRSLDPCFKGTGFETTFKPVTNCEERTARLVGLLCFAYKPIPHEDSKLICQSTINNRGLIVGSYLEEGMEFNEFNQE